LLEHLNFFNKIISELLAIDVKIDGDDKALILLSSFSESYDYIIITMLYGKEPLILEEVTTTLLLNEIRKRSNQDQLEVQVWWSWEEKKEKMSEFIEGMSLLSQRRSL